MRTCPYNASGHMSQTTTNGGEIRTRPTTCQDQDQGVVPVHSQTLDQIWLFFAKESTCHGIKNVVERHRRPWMRMAWLIIVVVMLIILVTTIIELLADYKNHSTVTRTDVRIQTKPEFPSVTFCNNSPFKNLNGTTDNPMFTLMARQTIVRKFLPVDFSDPDVVALLFKSAIEVNEAYSFTKEDLFQLATYEEQYLNISSDFETVDTSSGRCFTFNGPNYIAKHGVRKASFDGRTSGLRVFIDLKQNMYVPFDGLTAGIRVFVSHHPDTPQFEKDGLDVMPGTSTRMALRPVKIHDIHDIGKDGLATIYGDRLKATHPPYGGFEFLPYPFASFGSEFCQNIKDGDLLDKMIDAPFYSQRSCLLQCHILHASKMCRCYSHALYIKGLPQCSFGKSLYCILENIGQLKAGNINVTCDCPRPCTFTVYNSQLSASQLPSKPALEYLRKMVNASFIKELKENYLEVRVFLDSMLMRMEIHEPRYTLSSIFGFLGGQMGFFMGASLMTIVELGETLCLTVLYFIHKIFRMGKMN